MNEIPLSPAIAITIIFYLLIILVLNIYRALFILPKKNGLAIFAEEDYFNLTTPFVKPSVADGLISLNVFFQNKLSLFINQMTGYLFFPRAEQTYSTKYIVLLKKSEWNFYPVQFFPVLGQGIAATSSRYDGVLVIWQFRGSFEKLLRNSGYVINEEDPSITSKLKKLYGKMPKSGFSWIDNFKKQLAVLQSLS